MDNHHVTVIMLNYNKNEYTLKSVESVLESRYREFNVLVVDNGSSFGNYSRLKKYNHGNVHIARIEENCGYVGGINFALKKAEKKFSSDYYLIMNNDTVIDPEAINELIHTSQKYQDNCIVSGKVYNFDKPNELQYIGQWCRNYKQLDYPPYVINQSEEDVGQYDNYMEMEMLDDIYWLLPSKVFKKVGYYSHYFFLYGEQNDYALRAKKKGVKLIYTPKAKLWHHRHITTAKGKRKSNILIYWKSYAALLLAYLHLDFKDFLRFYLFKLFKGYTKICWHFITNGDTDKIKPHLSAQYYFTIWLFNKKENQGFNPYE